jgi:hypothetical protein
LINEHIKIHGLEFIYLPRIFVNIKTIIQEVSTSKFNRAFPIEGYVENYQGFQDGYNLLTKFGVRSTAELNVVISQERFESYITPLLEGVTGLSKNPVRPLEGDLIYFPLRDILFEIKYVDDITPFYQLQSNYTYTLKCEPFEYEDEVIDTGISEIDDDFSTDGYNATLNLVGLGTTGAAITSLLNGSVHKITLIDEGFGYTADPIVRISPPVGAGRSAQAVAITTTNSTGTRSIQSILITDPGFGYTSIPNIQFYTNDGNGSGAFAVAGIGTTGSVGIVTITNSGGVYVNPPLVTFTSAPSGGVTAIGTALINAQGKISSIRLINAGYGYTQTPTITVSAAGTIGVGTYYYGDIVRGSSTLTTAFVTSWDLPSLTLKARNLTGKFAPGELIIGVGNTSTSVAYTLNTINYDDDDSYEQNQEIEFVSDTLLDFSEKNPFGEV